MKRREAIQLLACSGGFLGVAATKRRTLADQINDEISRATSLGSSFIGICVKRLDTNEVLYERNSARLFSPASNNKLFTTALALVRLGPDHRFITTVLAEGTLENGVLHGDLALIGSGDPSMSDRMYPYTIEPSKRDPLEAMDELAKQVTAQGIKSVSGDIIADDSRYPWARYPLGWTIGDIPQNQGAPVSAVTLTDNIVRLSIEPGQIGEPAKFSLNPPVDYFVIDNRIHTTAGKEISIHYKRELGSREVVFWGQFGSEHASVTQVLAVAEPGLFAAAGLRSALERHGIKVGGSAKERHRLLEDVPDPEKGVENPHPAGLEVARRTSPPLLQILQVVDKVSQNLHAELVLREVGAGSRNMGTLAAGMAEMKQFLKEAQLPDEQVHLLDGSGLSRETLVTPEAIVGLLAYMYHSRHREEFESFLPVGRVDGSIKNLFKDHPEGKNIEAKTGALENERALSGYAHSSRYGPLAFAVMVNHSLAGVEITKFMESVLLRLVEA